MSSKTRRRVGQGRCDFTIQPFFACWEKGWVASSGVSGFLHKVIQKVDVIRYIPSAFSGGIDSGQSGQDAVHSQAEVGDAPQKKFFAENMLTKYLTGITKNREK